MSVTLRSSASLRIALSLLSFGCSCVAGAASQNCKFDYTLKIQSDLIVPQLRKNFGDGYRFFDYDKPVIYPEAGNMIVQLSATRIIKGESFLFEDLFFVEIDPC